MKCIYYSQQGCIIGTGEFANSTDALDSTPDGCFFLVGAASSSCEYISDNTITPRPIITASISSTILSANAIDSIEISTLPIPCTITIDSETYEVTDGVFEFTVDTPGTYIIKAECFPYQPKEWEVTAE